MKVKEVRVKRKSLPASVRRVVQHPKMQCQQYFLSQGFVPSTYKRLASKELLKDQGGFQQP